MAAHACVQRPQVDYNKIPWVTPIITSNGPRYYPGSDIYGGGNMMRTVINLPDGNSVR